MDCVSEKALQAMRQRADVACWFSAETLPEHDKCCRYDVAVVFCDFCERGLAREAALFGTRTDVEKHQVHAHGAIGNREFGVSDVRSLVLELRRDYVSPKPACVSTRETQRADGLFYR